MRQWAWRRELSWACSNGAKKAEEAQQKKIDAMVQVQFRSTPYYPSLIYNFSSRHSSFLYLILSQPTYFYITIPSFLTYNPNEVIEIDLDRQGCD